MKRSKSISLWLLVVSLLLPTISVHANAPIRIMVNGVNIRSEVEPFIENDRTLVPIRFISESLGYQVKWNNSERSVIITDSEMGNVVLYIGKQNYMVNGVKKVSDVSPMIRNDRTFVPLRFVAESFGHEVDWNSENRTVIVNEQRHIEELKRAEKPVPREDNIYSKPAELPRTNTTPQVNNAYVPPRPNYANDEFNQYMDSLREKNRQIEEKRRKIEKIKADARPFEIYMENKIADIKRTEPGYVYNYYDYLNEPEYEEEVKKKTEEIVELEHKITVYSLDDSYKAKGDVIKLRKELNSKEEELRKYQERHAYAMLIDAMYSQLREYQEKVQQSIREVQNS